MPKRPPCSSARAQALRPYGQSGKNLVCPRRQNSGRARHVRTACQRETTKVPTITAMETGRWNCVNLAIAKAAWMGKTTPESAAIRNEPRSPSRRRKTMATKHHSKNRKAARLKRWKYGEIEDVAIFPDSGRNAYGFLAYEAPPDAMPCQLSRKNHLTASHKSKTIVLRP